MSTRLIFWFNVVIGLIALVSITCETTFGNNITVYYGHKSKVDFPNTIPSISVRDKFSFVDTALSQTGMDLRIRLFDNYYSLFGLFYFKNNIIIRIMDYIPPDKYRYAYTNEGGIETLIIPLGISRDILTKSDYSLSLASGLLLSRSSWRANIHPDRMLINPPTIEIDDSTFNPGLFMSAKISINLYSSFNLDNTFNYWRYWEKFFHNHHALFGDKFRDKYIPVSIFSFSLGLSYAFI